MPKRSKTKEISVFGIDLPEDAQIAMKGMIAIGRALYLVETAKPAARQQQNRVNSELVRTKRSARAMVAVQKNAVGISTPITAL